MNNSNSTDERKFDFLTGLPNLTHFFELGEKEWYGIMERGGTPVVMYMDFSGMKFYNAKHGFAQGNNILKDFARIISKVFGKENCGRIGADHFSAVSDEEGLEEKLNCIFSEFAECHSGQTPPVHIGIYKKSEDDEYVSPSIAIDRAKFACTRIAGSYSSAFNYFDEELRKEAVLKQYIVENIDKAISEKWIQVYYQPIIRAVNEKVCDEEALARWNDPVKGFMSPGSFIPALEEAGLIYKLDLYVLEQVLETMQKIKAEGLPVVPNSINLSRSDFDSCDMVEEIRSRVDDAGISRDKITIELTESIIGTDFEFIKEQVERFQSLGFSVWMDDFGSGYSSLDVLQSIKFDLLKFDMSFMRKLNEGDSGKTILTELMRMATNLGLDTICEGVETEEQVRFLQEIGCSRLQGFYYSKPVPYEEALSWYKNHSSEGYENPEETEYYESIGRLNLYDLAVIAHDDDSQDEEDSLQYAFDTLPMGIIEVSGDKTRFVRSNQSYREFIKRFFGLELSRLGTDFVKYDATFMHNIVRTCCEQGIKSIYDEKMPDGSVVHSFARRISVNPVNGNTAVAIAVLSITDPQEGESYADIARALASNYYNIYVVDLDTEKFIEYSTMNEGEELAMERHGADFFESAKNDTMTRIYDKDREQFLRWFSKEIIIRELDEHGFFTITYRLVDTGEPVYVNMRVTRMHPGSNKIILGISNVDAYMKQKDHYQEIQRERDTMVRIMALSDGYLSLFTVDLDAGSYTEYSSSDDFDSLGTAKEGKDFFGESIINAEKVFHKDDFDRFADAFTKENVMREIRDKGSFTIQYRLMINDEPKPVILKAALFSEDGEEKMVVGVRAIQDRN